VVVQSWAWQGLSAVHGCEGSPVAGMNALDVATVAVVVSYGLLVLCTAGVLVAALRGRQ